MDRLSAEMEANEQMLVGLDREEAYALGREHGVSSRTKGKVGSLRGLTKEEAFALGHERGGQLTAAELQDITSNMVSTRAFRWCRARMLHALAGGFKQGKLAEALGETLDEEAWDRILDGARDPEELTSNLIEVLGEKLRENGWLK